MKKQTPFLYLIVLILLISACTPVEKTTSAATDRTLTIMTHDSFAVSSDLIVQFEEEHNVSLSFIRSGDTGAALNRAILSKQNPLADVFYGVDNTFLTRALKANLFEAYESPLLANIPDKFEVDPDHYALPVNYGDVCINYDKAFFEENNLALPQTLEDLTLPEYAGLLVVENPATSSPGLAFLLATIVEFGEDGYLPFWQSLSDNGLAVVSDWETAYYTNFSGSSGRGPQPMVVSYGSSPAAEVLFADTALSEAPTASIIGPNTCFRQIEFVGILAGTSQRELAEDFVDFMLSVPFQQDIPTQMFVFPVNQDAELPPVFLENVQISESPATLSPAEIEQNRSRWIEAWTEIVLK